MDYEKFFNDLSELVNNFGKEAVPETPEAPEVPETPEAPDVSELISNLSAQVSTLTDTVKKMQKDNANKAESPTPKKESADSAIRNFFGVK